MSEPTSSSKAYQMPESDASNPSLSMPGGCELEPSATAPVSSSRPRKSPKPKGLNLATLVNRCGTSEKCRELLCRVRWPNGAHCPRCNDSAVELETDKQLFYCKRCDYQFTVTAGTSAKAMQQNTTIKKLSSASDSGTAICGSFTLMT